MVKNLQTYHHAWLSKHPTRNETWLLERLADGFHVHHVDGNHDNNDPRNLILIDGKDHMILHGMDPAKVYRPKSSKPATGKKRIRRKELECRLAAQVEVIARLQSQNTLAAAVQRGLAAMRAEGRG